LLLYGGVQPVEIFFGKQPKTKAKPRQKPGNCTKKTVEVVESCHNWYSCQHEIPVDKK